MNRIFNQAFNQDSNFSVEKEILNYYKKELNPLLRKAYIDRLLFKIPTLKTLQKDANNLPFLDQLSNLNKVEIVNIHESFYKPQQAKVNALLKFINIKPITSVYIQPNSKKILVEQSRIRK